MKTILLNRSVTDANDRQAEALRRKLRERGTLLVNLMSSPGSGKTTLLSRLIRDLGDLRIGVLEADIASAVDAERISALGADALQLHTGGMCHMDAAMTTQALENLNPGKYDLIFLENVGNLICPAEYDTGAALDVMLLSLPEGDDKPLKYPLMFRRSRALIVTKLDTAPWFDFDLEACVRRVRALNPNIEIFPVSARTGQGMEALESWLRIRLNRWKNGEEQA